MVKKRISVGFLMVSALLAGALVLSGGCARKGPILVDFTYQTRMLPEESTLVVGVSPFKDDRDVSSSVVGKKTNTLNNEAVNDLVVQGTVQDRVATSLKKALAARGFTAKGAPAGDLSELAGAPADAKLLFGGEIKKFWVDAVSNFADTKVKATIELRVQVADREQKKIIRTLNVRSAIERTNITFSASLVEKTLSEALSNAMDQIFLDEELKSKLK